MNQEIGVVDLTTLFLFLRGIDWRDETGLNVNVGESSVLRAEKNNALFVETRKGRRRQGNG